MSLRTLAAGLALASLAGCASFPAPSPEKLASLPVVTFPAAPPAGDFILRLPGGQPIPARVIIEGTALASGAEQTLSVTLPRDLYVHQRWVSEDGKRWKPFRDLLSIEMSLSLSSDEFPKPGEMRLRIDRREAQ
jgi:hypothetical protein